MNRKVFDELLRLVLVDKGFDVKIDDYVLMATKRDVEIEIHLNTLFEEYKNETDEQFLCNTIVEKILSKISEGKGETNFEKVFPILKLKDFGVGLEPKLLRDLFTPELDIVYVEEKDEKLYFLVENESSEKTRLRAMENLDLHFIKPILENEELNLLRYPFSSFLNNSMILHENTRAFLREKFGEKVLLIVPSEAFVIFCKDDYAGQFYLERFLDELVSDGNSVTISDKMFRWNLASNSITNINLKGSLRII